MTDQVLLPRFHEQRWSLFSWAPTSTIQAAESEKHLLSRYLHLEYHGEKVSAKVPTERTPQRLAKVGHVQVGEDRFLNTLILKSNDSESVPHTQQDRLVTAAATKEPRNLVLMHGYGAGLGFFYGIYPRLSQVPNLNIYAVDWLGMANSSRPSFPKVRRNETDEETVANAEEFFVESLENWRQKMQIEKMVLAGHSFGGYMSSCYALKYPEHVEKLLLLSPLGVPEPPSAEERFPMKGMIPSIISRLWSMDVTPFSLIRTMGPWGPRMVRGYATRRFSHLDPDESKQIEEYIYHISAQPGSGEYALTRILYPPIWAKNPLQSRVFNLKMPTTFIYGTVDWMNYRHAMKAVQNIKQEARVSVVQDAGHHLYFDNPEGFANSILAELSLKAPGPYSVPHVEYTYLK